MDPVVAAVRSFNRTVTERVGALHDHYLSRDRPLGEARVLWEIGDDGCEVRTLRSRLGLDSGYLSRLLRSLESAGLVTVGPGPIDKRVRVARPTTRGRTERRVLDRRSDALASSMLDPLTPSQRQRLVAAMGEVERLITAAIVDVVVVDPADELAQHCLGAYFAELDHRFAAGFDPDVTLPADPEEMRPPDGLFLVATLRGEPIGCGALKFHGRRPAEVKRMWVAPQARGLGLGRRLLGELERRASDHGVRVLRLDTNKALVEAISMYRSAGFVEVGAFNREPYADHWFEKRITPGRRPNHRRDR
jgi:DNA-binding MarR family transcriptional regulator/GNAT superfamily N-acetyltransferase